MASSIPPYMSDADFDAKPMVLLIGQYSTGKTTFIRYLLERDSQESALALSPRQIDSWPLCMAHMIR